MRAGGIFWWAVALAAPAWAQDVVQTLPEVVVTPTRTGQSPDDLPVSITGIEIAADANTSALRLSEFLGGVPGVLARDRMNQAQDEQISIRGFGSRATFGVRGVRLYIDGIPATMPDGQGQTSHFALSEGQRIEVLRGPFSALYGNSSGGVIQLLSEEEPERSTRLGMTTGSYGLRGLELSATDSSAQRDYGLQADYSGSDGYRRHSAAERLQAAARYRQRIGEGSLTAMLNVLHLPEAEDPQGLTQAQFEADPQQAAPVAEQFNTRKSVDQTQLGVVYRRPLTATQHLSLMTYAGQREVQQFLSVPVAVQANPLHSGGVVDLDSLYSGADARWTWSTQALELSAGLAWERQDQQRRGYENFVGAAVGVQGALRRDEQNAVYSLDQYVQGLWHAAPRWTLSAGLRHSQVRFAVEDAFIVAGNPDDSGKLGYAALSPVAGVLFRPTADWRLHVAYGRGFETPTFNELAYRPGGASGLNNNLQAMRSNNLELGARRRLGAGSRLELALFDSLTRNELAVQSNSGGRSVFQSIGRAQRRGAELGWRQTFAPQWSGTLALTWLDAKFDSAFPGCGFPATCTIAAGTPLPGVPRSFAQAQLQWRSLSGWNAGLSAQASAPVTVNDTGSQQAPGYTLFGVHAGYAQAGQPWSGYLRVNNLFDREYAGSVIVNEANGRFYEPGAPRGFSAGITRRF